MYLAGQEATYEMSGRPKSTGIASGSRVTIREGAFGDSRQHLRAHAMRADVGTVLEGRHAGWPGWIRVRFDDCSMVHRLAESEISLSQRAKR